MLQTRTLKVSLVAGLLLTLSACSPHPGSGGWRAISASPAFERLEIRYDGKADFYTLNDDKDAAWRCFWSAKDKQTVALKCVDAGNASNEKFYYFRADAELKEGNLLFGNQSLGRYTWQPPTEASAE